MNLTPLKQAALTLGCSYDTLATHCRKGHLTSARKLRPPRGGMPIWHIDLDDARAWFGNMTPRPRRIKEHLWSPIYRAAPPGQLTDIQQQILAAELWHTLTDLQPDPALANAVRVCWSDGESFTIHPNGETSSYHYTEQRLP